MRSLPIPPVAMPEKGYESVSLPEDLLESVRQLIRDHPELGYTSLAEFVKSAMRKQLERDHAKISGNPEKWSSGKGPKELLELEAALGDAIRNAMEEWSQTHPEPMQLDVGRAVVVSREGVTPGGRPEGKARRHQKRASTD